MAMYMTSSRMSTRGTLLPILAKVALWHAYRRRHSGSSPGARSSTLAKVPFWTHTDVDGNVDYRFDAVQSAVLAGVGSLWHRVVLVDDVDIQAKVPFWTVGCHSTTIDVVDRLGQSAVLAKDGRLLNLSSCASVRYTLSKVPLWPHFASRVRAKYASMSKPPASM